MAQLGMYHDYTLWASELFFVLRSPELRLSELEAMVVLELKLRVPTDTVLAIIDSQSDPSAFIPRDRMLGFDEFCLLAMPGTTFQLPPAGRRSSGLADGGAGWSAGVGG